MKQNRLLVACLLWCAMFIPSFSTFAQPAGEVMIQGFNWESHNYNWYEIVRAKATDLQACQINAIWLPPSSDAGSPQGYLPRDLYKLTTKYGTQAQLQSLISDLHGKNVKVLADIVINHRVGATGWGDFVNPTWGCWATARGDEWTGACGNNDTGNPYGAARDLDHTNQTVRNDIKAWMGWLKNTIGFDGWRYDYVHGFGAGYVKEYNDATAPYFSVGELWDPNRDVVNNWVNGTQGASTAFDFPLKGILQEAVNGQLNRLSDNGKAPGLIGINPTKAVTFLDNHDTGSTQAHWPFPGDKVMQGYAYILTHPGTPMIFWDHFYDWGLHDQIKALVKVRKDNALKNSSTISIQRAEGSLYAAIIDGKVAMKIGAGSWSPTGSEWILQASGTNYAVWSKGTGNQVPVASVNPAGPYSSTTSFNVTINGTDDSGIAPTLYYTTDGSMPTTSSPSAVGSKTIAVASSLTLKVFTRDNLGLSSAVQSHAYTIGTMSGGFTVYVQKPSTWASTVKIHYWNALPSGSLAASTWPGVNMTADATDWYKFTFPSTVTSSSLVFNDGGSNKTVDLTRNKNGWYSNGTWSDTDPRIKPAGLTIHLKTTWTTPRMHYWNVQPAGAAANTTWPGAAMVAEGNGWFKYTIPTATCASLIFSNNGASQTADLSRCGEGWYSSGAWYSSQPARSAGFDELEDNTGGLVLDQNYPNPFSQATRIAFTVPVGSQGTLKVRTLMGKQVLVFTDKLYSAGTHQVELVKGSLAPGVYIYSLTTGKKSIYKKLVVE